MMNKTNNQKLQKGVAEKLLSFFQNKRDFTSGYYKKDGFIDSIENQFSRGFSAHWCMGGTSGNCWDDKLSTVSAEVEPELTDLDDFLMKFYPQTAFMQYKMITKSVKKDNRNDNDYYGGSTLEGVKSISVEALQDVLIQCGLQENTEYVSVTELVKSRAEVLYPAKIFKAEKTDKNEKPVKAGIANENKTKKPKSVKAQEKVIRKSYRNRL